MRVLRESVRQVRGATAGGANFIPTCRPPANQRERGSLTAPRHPVAVLASAGIVSPEPWRFFDCPDVRVGPIA